MTVQKTASIIVHEACHHKINKPNSKDQELKCYLKEFEFLGYKITEELKKDIIKHIDSNYPCLKWRDENEHN